MVDSIEREMTLNASIERVWQALTNADELAAWFPNNGASFEPIEGFIGWFEWDIEECTGRYAVKVESVKAPGYIAWRWAREADVPIENAYSTLVEWTLTKLDDGKTKVHMLESGFDRDKDRLDNVEGWKQELGEFMEYMSAL